MSTKAQKSSALDILKKILSNQIFIPISALLILTIVNLIVDTIRSGNWNLLLQKRLSAF